MINNNNKFSVGDRVLTTSDPDVINMDFSNIEGVIKEVNLDSFFGLYLVRMDKSVYGSCRGRFSERMLSLVSSALTQEQILSEYSID